MRISDWSSDVCSSDLDAARRRRFDRRGVGEEQMPPAEHRTRRIERAAMLLQIGPLDEIAAILLVDRHEHADDVAQQEAAAFRHAVQEHRLAQRRLREAAVLLIERIGFHEHFGPDSTLSWRLKKTGRQVAKASEETRGGE